MARTTAIVLAALVSIGCGISGALVNELEALVKRGALRPPTFPPPFPGGPTDVVSTAREFHDRWCLAARGVIEGPR